MPQKDKPKKKDDEILTFSKFKYLDKLESFAESNRLLENKLNTLIHYQNYKLESPLNSFTDEKLNEHLYNVFKKFKAKTKPSLFM